LIASFWEFGLRGKKYLKEYFSLFRGELPFRH